MALPSNQHQTACPSRTAAGRYPHAPARRRVSTVSLCVRPTTTHNPSAREGQSCEEPLLALAELSGLSARHPHRMAGPTATRGRVAGGGNGCWASAVTTSASRRATLGVGAGPRPPVPPWITLERVAARASAPPGTEAQLARRRVILLAWRADVTSSGRCDCGESHVWTSARRCLHCAQQARAPASDKCFATQRLQLCRPPLIRMGLIPHDEHN